HVTGVQTCALPISTRHSGFEGDDDALLAGLREDLVAMHGDQCLVGGHHVLAILDGLEHQLLGNGVATDELDDDIDFRVVDQLEDVGGDGCSAGIALRVGVTRGNLGNDNAPPGTAGNLLGITFEYIEGTATDGTQATDAHFHRFHVVYPICYTKRPGQTPAAQKSRTLRSGRIQVNRAERPITWPAGLPRPAAG